MASIKQTLDDILTIDGAMCAAVVDSGSGMNLGTWGSGVGMGEGAVLQRLLGERTVLGEEELRRVERQRLAGAHQLGLHAT
mgnify:CR=1 FL=1